MDNGKISVRYARALLEQANEQHCEKEVYEGLVRLTANYSLAIKEFNEILSNPMIGTDDKIQLLRAAIGEPIHPSLESFLAFVIEKKRENKIFLIALKYQEMYRKEKNILRADLTTASELGEASMDMIRAFVEETYHCPAEMHVKVNPTLIGGFILDIEHDRMDASVAGKLNKLKKELIYHE